jgi:DNA-binding transcriptional ArsR family regulator
MRRDAFQAIADPTRREILGLIANQSLNINAVSGNFDVSRTAIYKHIKILTECGLIVIKQQGRERYCEAKMDKLHEVSDWVAQYSKSWNKRLDSLEIYLNNLQAEKKKNTGKKMQGNKRSAAVKRKNNR